MGGEGHMLDMIQKMKLNREQRKKFRGSSFKEYKKPILSTDSLKNIHNYKELPKTGELSPQQIKRYRFWGIVLLVVAITIIGSLILFIINFN